MEDGVSVVLGVVIFPQRRFTSSLVPYPSPCRWTSPRVVPGRFVFYVCGVLGRRGRSALGPLGVRVTSGPTSVITLTVLSPWWAGRESSVYSFASRWVLFYDVSLILLSRSEGT